MAYTREQFNAFIQQKFDEPKSDFPWAPTIGVGLPVGAFSAGFIRTKSGKRVWDYYFQTLRHLEGTVPMGMLQTFHFSEAISPFAAPKKIDLLASQHTDLFKSKNFQDYLSRTTGIRISELKKYGAFDKGLYWEKTGSVLGTLRVRGGPVLSTNVAAISTGTRRSGFLIEWLGHVLGVKNPAFLKDLKETSSLRPSWLFAAGGKNESRLKLTGQYGYSLLSAATGRLNLLLKSPFDLEVVEDWTKKAPILKSLNLGVKAGPAHKMLARYTAKAGIAFALYKGLDYADYLGREYGLAASVPTNAAIGAGIGLGFGLKTGKSLKRGAVGAIGGALLGLTGEGPISSIANLYAQARVTQAEIANFVGLSSGKRKAEDYFPGLTKPTTLVASATLGLLLGGTKDWGEKLFLAKKASRAQQGKKLSGKAARDVFEQVDEAVNLKRKQFYDFYQKQAAQKTGFLKFVDEFKSAYYGRVKKGEFKSAGAGRTAMIGIGAYQALNVAGSLVAGDFVGAGTQAAATAGASYLYAKKGGAWGLGLLFLSSLLREEEDPEKLKRIYSGEEKVPIRSGRWWEAGRSDYQGKRPYYRPHRVALMRSGADKAALFGSESAYWDTDPFFHPIDFLLNPYAHEELMWEQGYKFPVSKTPFEDTPVLGPILAATIGRIIKPPKYMGRDQWLPETANVGPGGMLESASPEPIQRVSLKGTVGEQAYRMTEMFGLPGFAIQSVKEAITGKESFFEENQWATPSLVTGAEPSWWSLEMGGLGLMSEPLRRYIPHKRNQIEYINPLPSGLPSWLPSGDSYFLDFSRADIYSKIKQPGIRLPGEGLSQLNPELKGLDPEYYPNFWRLKVLCLDESTRVFTSDGIKEIQEINVDDLVYDQTGDTKKVIAIKNKREFAEKYKIKTYFNDYPLVCSKNHKILVGDKEHNISELKAKDITKDHYLLFPVKKDWGEETNICIGDYCNVEDVNIKYADKEYIGRVKGAQREMSFNIPANYQIGRVFGLFLAEGYSSDSGQVIWCFHRKERDTLGQEIKNFSEIIKLPWRERFLPDSQAYQVSINNKLLCRFLISLFGRWAHRKSILFDVTKFTKEFAKGIIDGYLDGDGSLDIREKAITLRATSTSRNLLDQIRLLCAFVGITSSIRRRKGKYKEANGKIRDSWTLDISPKDIKKLPAYKNADFSPYKYEIGKREVFSYITNNFVSFRVKDIEVIEDNCNWFDIAIESDSEHRFVTMSGIVHNSDVAPWSREYGMYEKIVSHEAAKGRLTSEQILELQTVKKQVAEIKKAKQFQNYKYDSAAVEKKTVKVTGELEPGVYLTDTFGSAPITLSGIDTSTLSLANIARQKDASLTAREAMSTGATKRAQVSDFLREYIYPGAEIDIFVHKDPSNLLERDSYGTPTVPAVVSVGGLNINRALVEQGLAESMEEGKTLDSMMATGGIQRTFGNFWESLAHGAETPLESFTPLAPVAKFIHQRSPIEEYERTEVYGKEMALWQNPVSDFLAPGLRTTAWWAGWRGLPREVKEKYMVDEYFDRLEYEKYSRLQQQASAEGDAKLAAKYQRQARRTKTGANPLSEFSARMALSTTERAYFDEFVRAPTSEDKHRISQLVSPQMRRLLHSQWSNRAADAARMRQEAGIPQEGDLASISRWDGLRSAEGQRQHLQEIADAQSELPVPGPNWLGWSAETDIEDYKVKTILDNEMDTFDYGIWPSDVRRVERRPWVTSVSFSDTTRNIISPGGMRRGYNSTLRNWGGRGPSIIPTAGGEARMEFSSPGRDRLDQYLRDPSIMQF